MGRGQECNIFAGAAHAPPVVRIVSIAERSLNDGAIRSEPCDTFIVLHHHRPDTPACCPSSRQILALRWAYFKDPWNRFDFFIVLGSTAGLLSLLFLGSNYGNIVTVIRTFRVGRVFRLVRGLGSMAQLFQTLLMTLPSLGNVGALLFLLFFIFAAMGVQLYAKVCLRVCLRESREGGERGGEPFPRGNPWYRTGLERD